MRSSNMRTRPEDRAPCVVFLAEHRENRGREQRRLAKRPAARVPGTVGGSLGAAIVVAGLTAGVLSYALAVAAQHECAR